MIGGLISSSASKLNRWSFQGQPPVLNTTISPLGSTCTNQRKIIKNSSLICKWLDILLFSDWFKKYSKEYVVSVWQCLKNNFAGTHCHNITIVFVNIKTCNINNREYQKFLPENIFNNMWEKQHVFHKNNFYTSISAELVYTRIYQPQSTSSYVYMYLSYSEFNLIKNIMIVISYKVKQS